MRFFIDMDGVLAKYRYSGQAAFYKEGFFLNLEPDYSTILWVMSQQARGVDVYVLSSCVDSPFCEKEKNEWLDKYCPIDPSHRIFIPYGQAKSSAIANLSNHDYLVDDYNKNLAEWEKAGGTGIKYLNGINHKRGTWKGLVLKEKLTVSLN